MKLVAYCEQCGRRHGIDTDPRVPDNQVSDWYTKHAGHRGVGFLWPGRTDKPGWVDHLRRAWRFVRRVFRVGAVSVPVVCAVPELPGAVYGGPSPSAVLAFAPNGNVTLEYGSSATYTITFTGGVASSTGLTAGRESTAVSNTTNKYLDYLIGGKTTTGGAGIAAGTIELWAYASVDDTPTYPDVFDGTDSDETCTSADIKRGALKMLWSQPTDTTQNRTYWMGAVSVAAAHGGSVPKNHGLFETHNTGVNLNTTASNHAWSYTPVYLAVA